jgi:hypothetical protein
VGAAVTLGVRASPAAGAGAVAGAAATGSPNPFGVFFRRPPEFQRHKRPAQAAVEIGASSARLAEIVSTWDGDLCVTCDDYRRHGLDIVLTVTAQPQRPNTEADRRNGGPAKLGSRLPADLAGYKRTLGEIIEARRPAIIAVENEPDGRMFWDDTPEHYLKLLSAACEVAHAKGIKCTDGGLTSATVQIMRYQHYVDSGQPTRAESYRSRLLRYWTVPGDSRERRARAEEGWSYLRNFKAAGADYANFHWYEHDRSLYREAIPYLAREARLPLMSNETGQLDELGSTTSAIMMEALHQKVRPVVWFSMDWAGRVSPARSLLNPDGTLRDSGRAYHAITSSLAAAVAGEPQTKIATGPRERIEPRGTVRFRFTAPGEARARFRCRLERPAARHAAHRPRFHTCRSPKVYRGIRRPGRYVFSVHAIYSSGKAERTPAKRVFRVRSASAGT